MQKIDVDIKEKRETKNRKSHNTLILNKDEEKNKYL